MPISRYWAKVDSVAPFSARTSFEQFDSCFLGVSLENKNFTPLKLKAMAEWIARRFLRCTVLVGDSIHRITLETTKFLDPDTASIEALELGHSFIQTQEHIFSTFTEQTQFTFETCSQIQTSEDYALFHQYLQDFFEQNAKFRSSVESFGRRYHTRRSIHTKDHTKDILMESRIRRSCDYFLEEFAIFACLQKRGFYVMVYPGLFSSLAEIVNGEYPELFDEINKLILVSLHFKSR